MWRLFCHLMNDRAVDQSEDSNEQSCQVQEFHNLSWTMWTPQVKLVMLGDSWEMQFMTTQHITRQSSAVDFNSHYRIEL